jgi:hypothetical protein
MVNAVAWPHIRAGSFPGRIDARLLTPTAPAGVDFRSRPIPTVTAMPAQRSAYEAALLGHYRAIRHYQVVGLSASRTSWATTSGWRKMAGLSPSASPLNFPKGHGRHRLRPDGLVPQHNDGSTVDTRSEEVTSVTHCNQSASDVSLRLGVAAVLVWIRTVTGTYSAPSVP